jgi:hypothetical protein
MKILKLQKNVHLSAIYYESIELDTTSVRSIQAICSNLICPRTFEGIAASIVEPGEDEVEAVNLSDP